MAISAPFNQQDGVLGLRKNVTTDDKFRRDTTYMMFIFLVKETLELKRSRVMFFRKTKLHYKSDKTKL